MALTRGLASASRAILVAITIGCGSSSQADGGAVVDRGRYGPYDATVFISPVPPRVGVVDFSVLLSKGGEPQLTVPIRVRADGPDGASSECEMHGADSGNRLLRAGDLKINSPGIWRIAVAFGAESATFEITVGAAPQRWESLLPWLGLWIPAALLMIAREVLANHQRQRRSAWIRRSDS